MNVHLATELLSSELRVHLIRHYRLRPGPQRDAAEALGVSANAVSANTKVLIDAGIVVVESGEDRRYQICRIDEGRLAVVLSDLHAFVAGTSEPTGDGRR